MTRIFASSRKQLLLQLLNKRSRLQSATSKGFTLIELLVVIVILGVLGSVGYQAYLNQIQRANQATAANTALQIAKSCAAALVTGDEGTWSNSDLVDGTRVTVAGSGDTCDYGSSWTVTAGADSAVANQGTGTASVGSDGEVIPR